MTGDNEGPDELTGEPRFDPKVADGWMGRLDVPRAALPGSRDIVELVSWPISGSSSSLHAEDVIWITIADRRPLSVHAGMMWKWTAHDDWKLDRYTLDLPSGTFASPGVVEVEVTREFLEVGGGSTDRDEPIYLGWVSISDA